MNKLKITGLITIIAGVPGLGGFWLIGHLGNFPLAAKIIVINAIFFRGICGTLGGILIWRGSKWGYYLTAMTWMYLIVVSFLTIIQLYNNGIMFTYGFLSENYSTFGRRFLYSLLKIVVGAPILYILLRSKWKTFQIVDKEEGGS